MLSMSKNKTLLEHASTVADSLAPHVENARDKAGPALADARDRAVPVLKDARDRAVPVLKDARDKAAPYVDSARGAAAPYVDSAVTKAAPLVEIARDRVANDVLPVLTAAVAAVDEATEDVRAEALKRGKAVVAAAKGEEAVVEQPSHRLRNLLIALGLGGIAFAVTRRLTKRQPSTTWQSSYTPPPAPTPPSATAAAGTHDTGASDPAEAAADATETPHEATTPDVPVAEMRVEEE
jgi:vacuolar-type H+-ATPase subunit H